MNATDPTSFTPHNKKKQQKQLDHAIDLYDSYDRALKKQIKTKASTGAAISTAAAAAAAAAASSGLSISGDEESLVDLSNATGDMRVRGRSGASTPESVEEGPERKRARQG